MGSGRTNRQLVQMPFDPRDLGIVRRGPRHRQLWQCGDRLRGPVGAPKASGRQGADGSPGRPPDADPDRLHEKQDVRTNGDRHRSAAQAGRRQGGCSQRLLPRRVRRPRDLQIPERRRQELPRVGQQICGGGR